MPSIPFLFLLAACSGLGLLASAIYVPSIPALAQIFSTSLGEVQLTLSVYLVVFAFATLVHGPLSDHFGRRGVLLIGLSLCVIASLACSLAPNIEILIVARALQAFGACAGMVVARALVRDMFGAAGAAQAISIVAIGVTLAPALAPILGGFLHVQFGWWASFDFVAAFTASLMLIVWLRLPETNKYRQIESAFSFRMFSNFHLLLRSRHFISYGLVIACASSGFYGFSAGAPVHLIQNLGVAPNHYGLYAALPSFGFIVGSLLVNRRLKGGMSPDRLISIGSLIIAAAGVTMLTIEWSGAETPFGLVGPMLLYGFGNGFIMPNAFAGSMRYFPHIAGAASALAGFLQQAAGALAVTVLSLLPQDTSGPLAGQICTAGVSAACLWWGLHGGRLAPLSSSRD